MKKLFVKSLCVSALILAGAYPYTSMADEIEMQYQRDVTACHINPDVDLQACLKEAAAARQAARADTLSDPAAQTIERNRTSRCDGLVGNQREECLQLLSADNEVQTEGSVSAGGVLRKIIITLPAEASQGK